MRPAPGDPPDRVAYLYVANPFPANLGEVGGKCGNCSASIPKRA